MDGVIEESKVNTDYIKIEKDIFVARVVPV